MNEQELITEFPNTHLLGTELTPKKSQNGTCSQKPVYPELVNLLSQDKHSKISIRTIYGEASGVPIYDPNDSIEVAIKNNIALHKPFKSWNAIFDAVGHDVFREVGILDLKQNFYRAKAQNLLSHYGEFPLTGRTKYERCCTVLFETPQFDIEVPTEGNRFYRDRGVPLLLRYLSSEFQRKGSCLYTSPEKLASVVGLVNHRYGEQADTLKETNPKFTPGIVSHFYLHCKPQLDKVIFSLLDELQNGYGVIYYRKAYRIITTAGIELYSDHSLESIIKEAEKYILERDFQTTRLSTVFFKRKADVFYKAVVKRINELHNLNWCEYRKTIQINAVDSKKLLALLNVLPSDASVLRKYLSEINLRFLKRMHTVIHSDYDRTNDKADKQTEDFISTITGNSDYQLLTSVGYTHDEAVKVLLPRTIFRVHKNCYEYQNYLMDTILLL